MNKKTLQRLGLLLREAGELLLQEADGPAKPEGAGGVLCDGEAPRTSTAELLAAAVPNDKQRAQAARAARRLGLTPARPRGRGSAA